jgi:TolB-like protein
MKTHAASHHRFARLCSVVTCVVIIGCCGFAQTKAWPEYQKAKQLFNNAKFDQAIPILQKATDDTSLDKKQRIEVYTLLSRCYIGKQALDKAKWAIKNMLGLEPPLIEPDPNAECPKWMNLYYEIRKDQKGSDTVERADPGIQTIAILDFANRSIDDREKFDPLQKGFADLMIAQLQGTTKLKVVERERISWILGEIGLENEPGKFDEKTAVRVGKQLGVNSILFGSFFKVGSQLKLLCRMVKVETSEILATMQETGDADKFYDLTDKLGEKVAKSINAVVSKNESGKGTATRSLDAQMKYSEGLVSLEKGDYKGAYEKFIQALTFDPNYEQAKKKADSIKLLIG